MSDKLFCSSKVSNKIPRCWGIVGDDTERIGGGWNFTNAHLSIVERLARSYYAYPTLVIRQYSRKSDGLGFQPLILPVTFPAWQSQPPTYPFGRLHPHSGGWAVLHEIARDPSVDTNLLALILLVYSGRSCSHLSARMS